MKSILFLATLFFAVNTATMAQAPMPSTETVMQQAFAQAAKTNKKVLLIFHASWCGWCKKMEASINDPACKKMFEDNYVVTYIDVLEQPAKADLENPGSLDLLKQYKGEKSGLPFWLVLDANGKLLADSQVRKEGTGLDAPGSNTGCPAQPDEVSFFTGILKNTSKLNATDLSVIEKRFLQNSSSGH
jgi:thiol-disulfide isomerase/thioredoxin